MAVWLCYAKFAKITSFLCLIQINVCSMLYDVRTQDRHDKVKYRVCRAELYIRTIGIQVYGTSIMLCIHYI